MNITRAKALGHPIGGLGVYMQFRDMIVQIPEYRGLQAVQVVVGTCEEELGVARLEHEGKEYFGFVDRGPNSPWGQEGKSVFDADKPYFLTKADIEKANVQVSAEGLPVRDVDVFDNPQSIVRHMEAYFETAIVGLRHDPAEHDKVLRVYRWGWTDYGMVFRPTPSSTPNRLELEVADHVSDWFRTVLTVDFPEYLLDD